MMATTRPRDHARGRWYGNLYWRDHEDFTPALGYGLFVVGEIMTPLTVVEETGTLGQEDHVITHGFTLRVPCVPGSTEDYVDLQIVEPTCTFHEFLPRWLDAVRPGRRLEGRLANYRLAAQLDEHGCLRGDAANLLFDVRIFIPDGEEV